MWGFVGYAGAADGSELPVGIMLDMLAGSASRLLQRDFALGAQLAQSLSIHSPAVFGWGFAHRLDRTKRGPAWRRFPISEEGAAGCYPGSAALLPSDGWIGGRSSCGLCAKYALPPFRPIPIPIPIQIPSHFTAGHMAGQLYQSLCLHP